MSEQIAVRPKASQQLAALIGMDSAAMLDVIKAQCFKTNPANVTDAQLAAFVSIAAELKLNPLLPGFLYAYPINGGGVVPIIGPDGIFKLMSEHPDIDSWEIEVFPADVALPPTHATAKIWRKGREKPLSYTAIFSEWKINSNPNWNTRPRHMLSLRALKHAARQLIHGIPGDEDDRHIAGEINVTPGAENAPAAEQQQKRSDPPARARKGANAAADTNKDAIDVPTVPAKQEPAAPPVQEKLAEKIDPPKPIEKPAEKPAEKVAEKVAEKPAPAGPRTSLKEGEEITVKCVVKKVYALNINVEGTQTPSVNANVEGEFTGPVYHFGAAKQTADGIVPARPEWTPGRELTLSLFGKINKKTGNVLAKVTEIASPAEGQTDTSEVDV